MADVLGREGRWISFSAIKQRGEPCGIVFDAGEHERAGRATTTAAVEAPIKAKNVRRLSSKVM